jgi:hydroxylamine dehydrogenase
MSFRSVFMALAIALPLILGAFLIQRARPRIETYQPNADFVKATGKCAECHSRQQCSIVHEYEMSKHASQGVSCLDCHQPQKGQEPDRQDHNGFSACVGSGSGSGRS